MTTNDIVVTPNGSGTHASIKRARTIHGTCTDARRHACITASALCTSSYRAPHPRARDGFNLLDPIAVVVLCTTSALAVSGARTINSIASVVGIAIIAVVLAVGFSHFEPANLAPSSSPSALLAPLAPRPSCTGPTRGSTWWPP